ncbi:hypothetical protein SLEP1_g22650 [Rubroshorea leprosula]|uniref:S-locus glycoprotein domain-containing protein n=1 Tax=Rubroshorea leprosula TaxID=152421 RepID=A0AAV5JIN0_9ROSI|nr:hypothetical protein SLEP1_g22650 [Rubroshorea leprosula]
MASWYEDQDPTPGLFYIQLDPEGSNSYIIRWNRSERYWTSGSWDWERKIFNLVPEMILKYIYDFSYIDNENGSYFTYSIEDSSIVSRFVMDISGQVKQLSWLKSTQKWNLFWSQPRQQCEVYTFCGAFGSCHENALPFCNCMQGFEPKSDHDWDLKDYSGGCVRKTQLLCQNQSHVNGKSDKF